MYTQRAIARGDEEVYALRIERGVDDRLGGTSNIFPQRLKLLWLVVVCECLFEVSLLSVCLVSRLDLVVFFFSSTAVELTCGHCFIAILFVKLDDIFGTADGAFVKGIDEATYAYVFELPD
jgi:hypothetical protein